MASAWKLDGRLADRRVQPDDPPLFPPVRALDDAAMLLRDMAELVFMKDALPLDQWRDALFEWLAHTALVAAMAEIDAIARPHDARPYAKLRPRWRRAWR